PPRERPLEPTMAPRRSRDVQGDDVALDSAADGPQVPVPTTGCWWCGSHAATPVSDGFEGQACGSWEMIDAGTGGDAGHMVAGPREHSADGCGQIAGGREVRHGRHPRREGVGESALIRAACDLLESEAVRMVHGDSTTAPCRAR